MAHSQWQTYPPQICPIPFQTHLSQGSSPYLMGLSSTSQPFISRPSFLLLELTASWFCRESPSSRIKGENFLPPYLFSLRCAKICRPFSSCSFATMQLSAVQSNSCSQHPRSSCTAVAGKVMSQAHFNFYSLQHGSYYAEGSQPWPISSLLSEISLSYVTAFP